LIWGPDTLHVVDVSAPMLPTQTGYLEPDDFVRGAAVNGGFVYTVGHRLQVFDVSDASKPIAVGFHNTYGINVTAVGGHVYVATGGVGIESWRARR